jgi:uncharacterized UPF0146 family protein
MPTSPKTVHYTASAKVDILDNLRDRLVEKTRVMDSKDFQLRGLWEMTLLFQPNPGERVFSYDVHIAQTKREGCCYVFGDKAPIAPHMIGADARTFVTGNDSLDIAILDAAYSVLSSTPDETKVISGTSSAKAQQRAQFVADEVELCLADAKKTHSRHVAIIGAIGTIVAVLQERQCQVVATDLDKATVNTMLHGILVEDGMLNTLHHVERADVAIVTGMTLATKTLAGIIDVAKRANTQIVLVAETGAWFAPEYCNVYGIHSVIGEPFPFYIFSGTSELHLYRKQKAL